MFRAYDRDGLGGDSTPLAALLGRAPRTWAEVLISASAASAG
jgi:hypothetical protein